MKFKTEKIDTPSHNTDQHGSTPHAKAPSPFTSHLHTKVTPPRSAGHFMLFMKGRSQLSQPHVAVWKGQTMAM